ncbi:uncharacterized protein LOC124373184 [Homalodisca vitripennis]|uniref:uncharacterized protein LOC124373184 n=1 Tax=Homalodisca vitripennis TaxID=197043 RepID=UPI001EEAB5DD|nr:uncharacterized protein LOC124373184 [Homalodisca vitripennis]
MKKCNVITCTRSKNPIFFSYSLLDLHIQRVTYVRDLGVTLTQTLSSDIHVQDICARANRLLGYILRSTRGLTSQIALKLLYFALVRQVLEFSAAVWSPYRTGLISDLQKIQDKFVRMVGVRQGMNYREVPVNLMSKELQISPLVVRRKLQDALFLFKLINDVIKCPELLQKTNFRVPSGTRSQELFWRKHHPTSYDWSCSFGQNPESRLHYLQLGRFLQLFSPSI